MKILFIYSETLKKNIYPVTAKKPLYANDEIPFGISYLSAVLKEHNHQTDVLIVTSRTSDRDLDRAVRSYRPEIICMTTVFREYITICKTASYIKKKYPEILIVAGGAHITLNPEESIHQSFDVLCLSEGEEALVELVDHISKGKPLEGIPNLWFKKDGKILRNQTRCFNTKLDAIPFPNRQMWQKYIVRHDTPISILVGRGCPFNCTYCCNHVLKKASSGQYVRFRSPENIIEEIKFVLEEFPKNDTIYFEVEAINVYMDYVEKFCNALADFNQSLKRTIFYGVNIRIIPSQDVNHLFYLFRKAGISYLNIGLESGSQRIRSQIMKRNYTNDDVCRVIKIAKKYRLLTMLYVMIGLPTETRSEYEETLSLIKKCKPYSMQLNIFCPYPGTDLYQYCKEHELLPKKHRDLGRNVAVLDMPQFSKKEIQKEYYLFFPKLYATNRWQYFVLKALSYMVQRFECTYLYQMTEDIIQKMRGQKI